MGKLTQGLQWPVLFFPILRHLISCWSPPCQVCKAGTNLSSMLIVQGPAHSGPAMNICRVRTKRHGIRRPRRSQACSRQSLASSSRQVSRAWDLPCLLPLPPLAVRENYAWLVQTWISGGTHKACGQKSQGAGLHSTRAKGKGGSPDNSGSEWQSRKNPGVRPLAQFVLSVPFSPRIKTVMVTMDDANCTFGLFQAPS